MSRSGVHETTKIHGKYQKDPDGPHVTLCYKDESLVERRQHVTSHCYVKSMTDLGFQRATHDKKKDDSVTKPNKKSFIWPDYGELEEITQIAYNHSAKYMEAWAKSSETNPSGVFDPPGSDYTTLPAAMASTAIAVESSWTAAQGYQVNTVEANDTYAEVVKNDGKTVKLSCNPNEPTIKVSATRWQPAQVLYGENWVPCFLYVSQTSGLRYWTWHLEPGKSTRGKGKKK